MADLVSRARMRKQGKEPSFALVVFLSAVALLLIFLGAYFLVGDKGRSLLPRKHSDPQPTSFLTIPAPGPILS
jgi:hypothetical protein